MRKPSLMGISSVGIVAVVLCIAAATADPAFPSNTDRNLRCHWNYRGTKAPPGYHDPRRGLSSVVVNTSLPILVPGTSLWNNSAVVLVKRTAQGGVFVKYFGNPDHSEPCETWSCSKIFAAMNAGGHMGDQCGRNNAGLEDNTTGKYGVTPLGDLVTIVVTYDTTHPPYSSNALGGWFEMVGGRKRALDLIQKWLNRTDESLGADYGIDPSVMSDLSFNFTDGSTKCNITPDTPHNGNYSNTLSALTMVEMLKRIVLAREVPSVKFPGTTWQDSRNLLYGAADSSLFPGRIWGGMSAGPTVIRAGINITDADRRSNGTWRSFSKDGGGYSFIRLAGEATFNGYGCYPDLDNPENGVEYFVSARVSIPGDRYAEHAYENMASAMASLNYAIYNGALN